MKCQTIKINSEKLSYITFKENIEPLLRTRPCIRLVDSSPHIPHDDTNNILICKSIGLILTDGLLSRFINKGVIEFGGLKDETAYSVLKTFLPYASSTSFSIFSIYNNKYYYRLSVKIRNNTIHNLLNKILYDDVHKVLDNCFPSELVALLSGIIDGDGYIGKGYISVSYNIKTMKGKIIDNILHHLASKNIVELHGYRDRPHYERVIRVYHSYLPELRELIFVPHKRYKINKIVNNIIKHTVCKADPDLILKLLCSARSIYIDRRYSKNNINKILVIYTNKNFCKYIFESNSISGISATSRRDGRCMVKFGSKCISLLRQLIVSEEYLDRLHQCMTANKFKVLREFLS